MKPGDLYIYLSSPQDAESLPVPLFRFSPNAHQPARAASDLGTNPSDLTIATSTMSTHWVYTLHRFSRLWRCTRIRFRVGAPTTWKSVLLNY